jgi:hypothetical protein
MPPITIAYYISAHGYGHGVRSCDIVRSLLQLRPELHLILVTDLPQEFLANRLAPAGFEYRQAAFDVGMIQLDSIRADIPATLERVQRLAVLRPELIRAEAEFITRRNVRLVVADIPSIPLESAAAADIPGVAVGNFSWDWIYSAHTAQDERWRKVTHAFAEGYRQSRLLLRLPFHAEMEVFPRIEDIPLLAAPGCVRREEIAGLTGARPEIPWVLLAFTSLDWDETALRGVERLTGYEFFTVPPLGWQRRNMHAVDPNAIRFSDVLCSCDMVVSKPGYGILSDCAVNRKPLIYTDRQGFAEYPILEKALRRFFRSAYLPSERLYRGDLRQALEAIAQAPEPKETLSCGGGAVAARRLLEFA